MGMIDGVPTETEEIEPLKHENERKVFKKFVKEKEAVKEPDIRNSDLFTKKRIIKKLVMIDGIPTETEEEIDEPENEKQGTVLVKRIIKKIIMVNGVPTETEEEIVEPEIEELHDSQPKITAKRKIIKKVVMIDGIPTETEEEISEPESMEVNKISRKKVIK